VQESGLAPIHFAAKSGVAEIGSDKKAAALVKVLISVHGADPALRCRWAYMTPMQYAASLGCPLVVAALAQSECNVNAAAPELGGGTALHLAQQSEDVKTVQALLDAGADPNRVDSMGRTPLRCAEHTLANGAQDPLCEEASVREIIELLRTRASDRPRRYPKTVPTHTLDNATGTWKDVNNRMFAGQPIEIRADGSVTVGQQVADRRRRGDVIHGRVTEVADAGLLLLDAGGETARFRLVDGMLIERPVDDGSAAPGSRRPIALARIDGPNYSPALTMSDNMPMSPLVAAAAIAQAVTDSVTAASGGDALRQSPSPHSAFVRPSNLEESPSQDDPPPPPSGPPPQAETESEDPDTSEFDPADHHGHHASTSTPAAAPFQEFHVGDRVLFKNASIGLVRFKGETEFSKGAVVYGVQLVTPEGKHNGTVGTTTYFRCRPRHGIFAKNKQLKLLPPEKDTRKPAEDPEEAARREQERLQRLEANSDRVRVVRRQPVERVHEPAPFSVVSTLATAGRSQHGTKGLAAGTRAYTGKFRGDAHRKSMDKQDGLRKSFDKAHRNSRSTTKDATPSPAATSTSFTPSEVTSASSSTTSTPGGARKVRPPVKPRAATSSPGVARAVAKEFALESRVMLLGVKKMGWVKFIGPTHLGDGPYIGVELSGSDASDHGEHSGTVDGKKYFKCKRGHGLLIPAAKVSWRGRKVSNVLKAQQ
jgi:hypothetical protein